MLSQFPHHLFIEDELQHHPAQAGALSCKVRANETRSLPGGLPGQEPTEGTDSRESNRWAQEVLSPEEG